MKPELLRFCKDHGAPGVAAVIFDRTGVLNADAAGFADLTGGREATTETAWAWFSVTKMVTAELLLSSGLDLETPVAAFLPWFRPIYFGAGSKRGQPPIPLGLLASHGSGMPNPPPLRSLRRPQDSPTPGRVRVERFLRWRGRLSAAPGTRALYSNLGYVVLGEALASAAALPITELIERHLFRLHRGAALDWSRAARPATAYLVRGAPYTWLLEAVGAWRVRGPAAGPFRAYGPLVMDAAAAGGLVATVLEVGAHFSRYFEPELSLLTRPVPLRDGSARFGLGWWLAPGGQVEHGGSGLGFSAHVRLDPARGLGAAAVTNQSGNRGPMFEPIEALTAQLLDPSRGRG